jgi:hypothetical protein
MHAFNGKLTVAIAEGDGLHQQMAVMAAFNKGSWFNRIRWLAMPNDPELRETATFLPLLLSVASVNSSEATFYAHTKGNSTSDDPRGATYWRNAMYANLLDRWKECLDLLTQPPYVCVGTHKMHWGLSRNQPVNPYPTGLRHGEWMLAGTFFWFRNDAVFGHPRWRYVPADRYGTEAWLSGLFSQAQAASVFQPWPEDQWPTPSPYSPSLYPEPIDD